MMNLTPIRDLVKKTRQIDPKKLGNDSFTYVDISSVDKDTKLITVPQILSVEDAPSRARKEIKVNDVLVATVRPNLNGVAIVPRQYDNQIASTGYCVLRADIEQLDSKYLFYFTQTKYFVSHLTELSTGAGYPAVSDEDILDTQIPLPPLTKQKRIASLLARADRLRQMRRTAHDLGDALLKSVFLEMFGDPIRDSHKYQKEALIDIINPDRPITYGILMPGENLPNGIPYVRVVDIQGGNIDVSHVRRTSKEIDEQYKRSRLLPNDLLLTIRGQVGRLAIVPHALNGANITQDTARLDPLPSKCNVYFLYGCLAMPSFQHLMQTLTRGVAVTGINLGDVKELPIPLPPLSLQEEFAGVVARVEGLRARMSEAERQVEGLFESLLAQSFSN